ncbi:MAG TPA: hypothetical protein DC047_05370 [Blastocatellia bacterium]|nr:hypothetical protein [Blastocatellia bacterium]
MKFYFGTKGLVQSLTALSLCLCLIVSVCVSARARALQPQPQDRTNLSQSQTGKLSAATALATTSGVIIRWRSNLDADNLGFNIYRLKAGSRVRVNREIIPGAVFVVNRLTRPSDSHSYSWFDPEGSANATYYIEAVSIEGLTKLDERAITVTPKSNAALDQTAAPSGLSRDSAANGADVSSAQKSYPAAEAATLTANGPLENQWAIAAKPGLKISIKRDGWYRITQQDMAGAGFNPTVDRRNLRLFGDGQEVAINTSQSVGPFSSSDYIEFYGRGIDVPTSDTRIYYLIADTVPGKRVSGELHLDATAAALPQAAAIPSGPIAPKPSWFGFVWSFLNLPEPTRPDSGTETASKPERATETKLASEPAPSSDTPPSSATPLPVTQISPAGSEHISVASSNDQLLPRDAALTSRATKKRTARKKTNKNSKTSRKYNHAETTNAISPASFDYTVEQRDRTVYFVSELNGDLENFFGGVLSSSAVNQTIEINNPAVTGAGPAHLEIAIQGVSAAPHQVDIKFNNVAIGSLNYFGMEHAVASFDVPVSIIQNGANTLTFVPVAGGGVSLIDYARLTYPHAFKADAGKLKFNLRGTQSLKVDGFATANVRLIDYTDPLAVTTSSPSAEVTASGYAITVRTTSPRSKSQRLLYAFPEGQFEQPAALTLNQPSNLNLASNAADFLIVAHKSIIPALGPLVTARTNQGFTVSVVDIDDVYDEFSYGLHGPQAIKDFLSLAATRWSMTPRYVIFAGDASLDPRNYMGSGNFDFVPTKLIDATFNETASDDWLADFDDDGAADIAIGRLPVRTANDANLVISKIVNFLPGNIPQNALLIADDPGTPPLWDFETANDDVQALLPPSMTVQRVNVRTEPSPAQATANIINGFNQGRAVVNYSGHGNVDVWSGSSIFTTADATALTNGNKLPLVIVMDCLNGYFQDPNLLSLSEAFLLAPNGGAVAAFASSGLTSTPGQRQMELQLYSSLYGSQPIAVGDAIKTAKAATTDIDVRRTWIYFGDPSLKIR